MEYALESLPELTTRYMRKEFVAYRKDLYPKYGEGVLPCYNYLMFKTKTIEYHDLNRQLLELYAQYPRPSKAPAEIRAKMVQLEVRSSELEHDLCID